MTDRILAVDDSATIRKLVSTSLEPEGFEVTLAVDGVDGIDKAAQSNPSLIVSDVVMPRMDGWAFVRMLRARPATALTPVIFLTSLDSEQDRMHGFKLGADDYLPKPFHSEELVVRVKSALQKSRSVQGWAKETLESKMGVAGEIDTTGLSILLGILSRGRKTGILVVEGPNATARLFLRAGAVVRAVTDRAEQRGPKVVYDVLRWPRGKFRFSAVGVDVDDEVRFSTADLLENAARQVNESPGA